MLFSDFVHCCPAAASNVESTIAMHKGENDSRRKYFDKAVISSNLKSLLKRPRWAVFKSYTMIAKKSGIKRASVGNHITGKSVPNAEQMMKWCMFLEVREEEITGVHGKGGANDWRAVLREVLNCSDETQFSEFLHNRRLQGGDTGLFATIRRALSEASNMGSVNLGWAADHFKAAKLMHEFGLKTARIEVVEVDAPNTSHLFDAAAEAIWMHTSQLFEIRKNARTSPSAQVIIQAAIGSGHSVARVMDKVIERIAKHCHSMSNPSGIPLTFDFHPMASSIHTLRPGDNIPVVFLHRAIDGFELSNLKERVYPTPDAMYRRMKKPSWFFKNIDFVITSVAATDDSDSMLIQHL